MKALTAILINQFHLVDHSLEESELSRAKNQLKASLMSAVEVKINILNLYNLYNFYIIFI
jgi:hypothetical protein